MSEQFTFQQAFRQSCTVDLEKGLVPARRQVVKSVSDQFLAGSPFTNNDHWPVEQGGTGNVVQGFEKERGLADDGWSDHFVVRGEGLGINTYLSFGFRVLGG